MRKPHCSTPLPQALRAFYRCSDLNRIEQARVGRIDVEAFGYWLWAAFGQPATSGTNLKTHVFQSGNWTLPSMAIETAMPDVPR